MLSFDLNFLLKSVVNMLFKQCIVLTKKQVITLVVVNSISNQYPAVYLKMQPSFLPWTKSTYLTLVQDTCIYHHTIGYFIVLTHFVSLFNIHLTIAIYAMHAIRWQVKLFSLFHTAGMRYRQICVHSRTRAPDGRQTLYPYWLKHSIVLVLQECRIIMSKYYINISMRFTLRMK